jgi:hypothetical protein
MWQTPDHRGFPGRFEACVLDRGRAALGVPIKKCSASFAAMQYGAPVSLVCGPHRT